MEGRERRSGAQLSPERYVVWTELSGNRRIRWQQGAKVPVVYYLCKGSLSEHPHFIEVPISSTDGLYLRDVIDCLVVLRGNRMPAMYSWSCKRSYRNGFVWQDLAKDDIILPSKGDYILKGSLLLDQIPADGLLENVNNQVLQKNQAHRQKEHILCSRNLEASPCLSPATTPSPSSRMPSDRSSTGATSSSSFNDCRDFVPAGAPVSPTQTADTGGNKAPEPFNDLSIHDELSLSDFNDFRHNFVRSGDDVAEGTAQIPRWNDGMDTLMALIRAEVNQLDGIGGEKRLYHQSKEKIKRSRSFMEKIGIKGSFFSAK